MANQPGSAAALAAAAVEWRIAHDTKRPHEPAVHRADLNLRNAVVGYEQELSRWGRPTPERGDRA